MTKENYIALEELLEAFLDDTPSDSVELRKLVKLVKDVVRGRIERQ